MDWYLDRFTVRHALARHAGRIAAGSAALLLLIALASAQVAGPSLFNLLTGPDGARNLLGYPGAMLGGSLRDLFGGAALLVPALVFNWSLSPRGRPALPWYVLHGLVLTGLLAVLVAAVSALAGLREAGAWHGGMVGQAGMHWMQATTGLWAGMGLVLLAGGYAVTRVIYLHQARLAWRDLAGFLRFGGQHLREASRGAARQGAGLGQGGLAAVGALAAGLLLGYRAGWYRLLAQLRAGREGLRARLGPPRHAVSRVKASPRRMPSPRAADESAMLGSLGATAAAPQGAQEAGAGDESFDAWFEVVNQPRPVADSPPPPAPPEGADNPAAEPYRQWQERLARYRDNLDLDWHGRGKFPEARDPFADDEAAGDAEEA